MNRNRKIAIGLVVAAVANGFVASTAWACAVCQGNRDSDLVKGAEAGVLTMVLITYGVLMLFGAMIVACFVRSRRRTRRASSTQEV